MVYDIKLFHKDVEYMFKKVGIDAKFTIIKTSNIKNPTIVMAMAAFRMPDPYKDESKYTNGLNLIFDNYEKIMPKSILRIYYDNSVLKKDDTWRFIIEKAKKTPFVELILFEFKQFKVKNSFYHEGVFGMIVRYFILFDFKGNDTAVGIDDIDAESVEYLINVYDGIVKKALKAIEKYKGTFVFGCYNYSAYIRKPRLMLSDITDKYHFNIRALTQPSVCQVKLKKKILLDFMKCVLEKCKEYRHWMKETKNNMNCKYYNKENIKRTQQCAYFKYLERLPTGAFMFGTDEYFLNSYILGDFLKNKRPFIVNYAMPQIVHYHYCIYNLFKAGKAPLYVMLDMYEYILGKKIHTKEEVHKAFNEVDKIVYVVDKEVGNYIIVNEETKKIMKKIYEFIAPRANIFIKIKDKEVYEDQMFHHLKTAKFEDLLTRRQLRLVEYKPNFEYTLTSV